jgi:hypothetical protein
VRRPFIIAVAAHFNNCRLVPESVNPGKSYFQVELAGEVYDSPYFSVVGEFDERGLCEVGVDMCTETVGEPGAAPNPRRPTASDAQALEATTPPIELVTQTIVLPVSSSSEFHCDPIS